MAIREEHDFLSENERQFLFECIHNKTNVRADGRELMQQRKVRRLLLYQIRVQFRRTEQQSQAEVQLGRTRVIANVHGEIVPPFPDRPTEGFLHFNVELSPMASQNFEASSRPSPIAVELARIVDRGIRECRALDTEALAIVAGEKVWSITCNIHVVDHGGNLVDCVSLAAIAAMMHFRRPEVSVQNSTAVVYNIDEHAAVPPSLHHIPISISFCFIENREDEDSPIIFMDPTDREERITDGSITFTFNSFRELCAVHKIGGAAISTTEVLRCAQIAAARVGELTEFLREEAEQADKVAIDQRRALLRGREFHDVSSVGASNGASQSRAEVDLGVMTDFKTLHKPIALRDDPTQEEEQEKVTSMAQLLESLETAAEMGEQEPAPSAGVEMTEEARAEFQKLTASVQIRDLVKGKTEAATATANKKATVTKPQPKKKKSKKDDSDSEEESVIVQSEFQGKPAATPAPPAPSAVAAETAKKATKTTTKKGKKDKKAVSSDDDSDDAMDLSAAIKRKK
ncbi:TPA: hypothetical protein N0F65_001670 [Lagenidium giganteum]|uniref:Exosome complex component RRP45 n=1 Tax=Lagenidium giganteum TaxID=4803 RepID=A0AAV2YWZ0_9STRA|nr:TPA: hypothetical protein N0F65_001670 [Lagenidium giganteum]